MPYNRYREGSVPGHIRYERPLPKHKPVLLASSSPSTQFQLLHHLPITLPTEVRNSSARGTAKSRARITPIMKPTARLKRKAPPPLAVSDH